jgi:serine/threonine-protein kinase
VSEILKQLQSAIADRYLVERELGRGGMATVYLATDERHERQVAIKVLHPDLSATIGAERFEREIKLAAKLQHPHILGLYDSGEANGLLYYVMPFIEGESVRDKLEREKQLSVDEAIQITLEVADALAYAHKQGSVHAGPWIRASRRLSHAHAGRLASRATRDVDQPLRVFDR